MQNQQPRKRTYNANRQRHRKAIYDRLSALIKENFVGAYEELKRIQEDAKIHTNLFSAKVWKERQSVAVSHVNDRFGYAEWDKGLRMVRAESICFSYVYNHLAHLLGESKIEGTIWVFDKVEYAAPRFL